MGAPWSTHREVVPGAVNCSVAKSQLERVLSAGCFAGPSEEAQTHFENNACALTDDGGESSGHSHPPTPPPRFSSLQYT